MITSKFRRQVRSVAGWGSIFILAGAMVSLCSAQTATAPGATAANSTIHTMSEFDFLIGTWQCLNTEAGKPDTYSHVLYEWMYNKQVLKETVSAPGYNGEFMTTLDKKSNTFKGVAVGSSGGYVVWENTGMKDNKSNEVGYKFANGQLNPVSRSEFERLSSTHYVFHDFGPDTESGKGAPTDTEDCKKNP